jgi:uncharacterized protein (DUF885 family)
MLTRRAALATSAAAVLAACATPPRPKPAANQDEALNAKLEAIFDERLSRSPQFATNLGDKRGYGSWDVRTAARAAEDLALTEQRAAEVRKDFANAELGAQAKLSFDLLQRQSERAQAAYPWRLYSYRFNQMFGAQSQTPTFLINQHRVTSVDDAKAYIARLQGVRDYLGQIVAESEDAVKSGITPPQFVYGYVIPAARNVIKGAPFEAGADSPLWADAKAKIGKLAVDDAQKAALLAAAEAALKSSVAPAYQTLIAALEQQQPKARTTDGVWALPKGEAYYAWALKSQTTTDLSADAIHRIGLDAVARLHDETRQIMAKVGFKGDLKAFFDFMETDPRFYEPQTPEGRASYIAKATAAIAAMKARCPDYFNLMPKASMEVRAVEPFREKSAGLAFYERPSADGARPGVYYANTSNMKALPLYQLEALAYHEGIPGHHFQIAIAQELAGIPRFRRFGGGFTAYSEGWALYTEKLGKEMGFYQDPYADFGRIVLELRRAIRLVVDTGLHAKKWPRQQAIQYILDNQPGEEAQARLDIDRYIVMPGQATAYLIGQMKFFELREKAKAELGAKFSIKGYHDVVLGNGAVPLDVLEDLVMAWARA